MHQAHIARKLEHAHKRIWIDAQAEPFATVNCCCGATQDLDDSQGFDLMTSRLNAFLNAHEACLPAQEETLP